MNSKWQNRDRKLSQRKSVRSQSRFFSSSLKNKDKKKENKKRDQYYQDDRDGYDEELY